MQKNVSGKSLLQYKAAGFLFILGGSRGIPSFVLDAIKDKGSITIELQGLKNIVESGTKEYALTVFNASYDNKSFEAMLPLSCILADGAIKVTAETVTLKSNGKQTQVLRVLGMVVNGVAVTEVSERDVWAAIEAIEKQQPQQQGQGQNILDKLFGG